MKQIVGMLDQFQSRVVGYEQRLSLATGRIATAYASLFHRQTLESSKVDKCVYVFVYMCVYVFVYMCVCVCVRVCDVCIV